MLTLIRSRVHESDLLAKMMFKLLVEDLKALILLEVGFDVFVRIG